MRSTAYPPHSAGVRIDFSAGAGESVSREERSEERDRTLVLFLNADETDAISCARGASRLDIRVAVAASQLRQRLKKKKECST